MSMCKEAPRTSTSLMKQPRPFKRIGAERAAHQTLRGEGWEGSYGQDVRAQARENPTAAGRDEKKRTTGARQQLTTAVRVLVEHSGLAQDSDNVSGTSSTVHRTERA